MNWDAAGAIGELVGAAAVVLTLVYLARQIKHSSTQVKVNSITALNTLYNDAYLPIYNSRENMNIWVTGLSSPGDLPGVDRKIFFLLMLRLVTPFDTAVTQYLEGTLDKATFQGYTNMIKQLVESPGGKAWVATGQLELLPEARRILGLEHAA